MYVKKKQEAVRTSRSGDSIRLPTGRTLPKLNDDYGTTSEMNGDRRGGIQLYGWVVRRFESLWHSSNKFHHYTQRHSAPCSFYRRRTFFKVKCIDQQVGIPKDNQ